MSRHHQLRRCKRTGKVAYRDRLSALLALASTQASRSSRRDEKRAYLCEFSRGVRPHWHLTSRPDRKASR
jgi:hypothetical protein